MSINNACVDFSAPFQMCLRGAYTTLLIKQRIRRIRENPTSPLSHIPYSRGMRVPFDAAGLATIFGWHCVELSAMQGFFKGRQLDRVRQRAVACHVASDCAVGGSQTLTGLPQSLQPQPWGPLRLGATSCSLQSSSRAAAAPWKRGPESRLRGSALCDGRVDELRTSSSSSSYRPCRLELVPATYQSRVPMDLCGGDACVRLSVCQCPCPSVVLPAALLSSVRTPDSAVTLPSPASGNPSASAVSAPGVPAFGLQPLTSGRRPLAAAVFAWAAR